MKKFISLILVLAILLLGVFVLTGCDNNAQSKNEKYQLKLSVEGQGEVTYSEDLEKLSFDKANLNESITVDIESGEKVIIAAQGADEWRFVKWKKDGVDYSENDWMFVTVTEEVEYVAVFGPAVTITFDYNYGNGDVVEMSRKVEPGTTAQEFEETREGYTLGGWYLDKECTNKFDFSTPITEDIRVYAKWIEE